MVDIAAELNGDGRVELFAVSNSGRIFHKWQGDPLSNWSEWTSFGKISVNTVPKLLGEQSQTTVDNRIVWERLTPQRQPDITVRESIDGGKVVWQSPSAGTEVTPGSVVKYSFGVWTGTRL